MQTQSNGLASIVFVTCGAHDFLERALEAACAQSVAPREIILVDNSAGSGVTARLQKDFPGVRFLPQSSNALYAQGLNIGIAASSGEWVLCLNDDVKLAPDFLERALGAPGLTPDIGMISGKVLRSDGKTVDSTGLFLSPWRSARERGYGRADCGRFAQPGPVFGVNGAVALYRRGMLEGVRRGDEYFDSRFGLFYEDLDLAWRARRSGWRGWYVPGALAYHVRGASCRQREGLDKPFARRFLSDEHLALLVRNRYRTIARNESAWGFVLHLPWIFCYELLQWGYLLMRRPRSALLLLRGCRAPREVRP